MLGELEAVRGFRPAASMVRARVAGKYFACGEALTRVRGVTYGPFPPDSDGVAFPTRFQVHHDFDRMRAAGINAIRTYCVPPRWLLDQLEEHGVRILIDVPWSKHVCFLHNREVRAQAHRQVRAAAMLGLQSNAILGYSIGNEIPADVIRWHGARNVERFLSALFDTAKQADPDGLVTYANYPLTEYLDLSFLDFATFNVYLHDPAVFRNYLFRLQNLVGERPLVVGELGMDTIRHGESAQAEFLASHVREATMAGVAGAFIFAWTDEWYTGGHLIDNWAFGITQADRTPKTSYHRLCAINGDPVSKWLGSKPRVSVVVCTFNGGHTLDQCLGSLLMLDYPDYEVIVVDDGSTDLTRSLIARYPRVRAVHQENLGLSTARNVGVQSATGSIIAYTDSDCFADPDWLTLLVNQLERTGAAGVGGPNLAPPTDWVGACVAASPGQPSHVLLDDQTAEHVPGCNMAFRREVLESINGFDPQFRRAGDDVDICWRLQHAGYWITFAPGATISHHRRASPGGYLRQQAGYGEAEGLLHFKHPEKFTGWGAGKWAGVVYGTRPSSVNLGRPMIYRGTFGTGMFQCLYQPAPGHWAVLPGTLEWHGVAALLAIVAVVAWKPLAAIPALMIILSIAVATLQASKASLPRQHRHWGARVLVGVLCYLQPLVRSWSRYRVRLIWHELPRPDPAIPAAFRSQLPWFGTRTVAYWSQTGRGRIELLKRSIDYMNEFRIGKLIDSGWSDWDISVYCQTGIVFKIATVEEDHGGGRRLVRIRYRLSIVPWLVGTSLASVACATAVALPLGLILTLGTLALGGHHWWRASRTAVRVVGLFDVLAAEMSMVPCAVADA